MEQLKRYVLCILAFFLLKYWVVSPYLNDQETLEAEYDTVVKTVNKAEELLGNTKGIEVAGVEVFKIKAINSTLFFPDDIEPKDALSLMQKKVRVLMEKSDFEIVSITWGEPQSTPNSGHIRLPLSFVAKTGPGSLHRFLQEVAVEKPLLLFDTLNIVAQRDKIQITGQIIGFTRNAAANKVK